MKNKFETKLDESLTEDFSIELAELSDVYTNLSYMKWEADPNQLPSGKQLIPSEPQRFKKSPGADDSVDVVSTWNVDKMTQTLISWITQQARPVLIINIRLWDGKHRIALLTDGESKLHFYQQFLNGKNVFQVTHKGEWLPSVREFLSKSDAYVKHFGKELSVMFQAFKEDELSGDFITPTWMINNGYDNVLERLKTNKATIQLVDLPTDIETDTYQMLGSTAAKQLPSQLAVSHILPNIYKDLYFNFGEKPNDRLETIFKEMISTSKGNNKFHILNKLFEKNLVGASYEMLDVYLFNMIVLLHTDVIDNKLEFETDIDLTEYLRIMTRRGKDDLGVYEFKRRARAYNRLNLDEKKKLINRLKDVVEALGSLFVHMASKEVQTRFNGDSRNSTYTKLNKMFGERWVNSISNSERAKLNISKDDVFIMFILYYSTRYTISSPGIENSSSSDVFDKILDTIESDWADFVFSSKTQTIYNEDWSSQGKLNWNLEQGNQFLDKKTGKITDIGLKQDWIRPNSIGEVVSTLNAEAKFGLEIVARTIIMFFKQVVGPTIQEKFGDYDTSTKVRMALDKQMRLDDFHKDDFTMINSHGDIFNWKQMQIGHPKPKAKSGNELTNENFIAELDTLNQGKYRDDEKDVIKYYSLAEMKRQMMRKEAFNNEDDDMLIQLKKVQKTLSYLVNYQNINLDMSMEFEEEGYLVQ
tara:strand:- start:518 stop:2617 length:2100 start_codon:yes stop_codon:yes gene_type:complete